jgi:hypothetical protein
MTELLRGVSALVLLATLGLVPSRGDTPEPYRQRLENAVCAQGLVEQRLDCLGRQIDALRHKLDEPRVVPLGIRNGQ